MGGCFEADRYEHVAVPRLLPQHLDFVVLRLLPRWAGAAQAARKASYSLEHVWSGWDSKGVIRGYVPLEELQQALGITGDSRAAEEGKSKDGNRAKALKHTADQARHRANSAGYPRLQL